MRIAHTCMRNLEASMPSIGPATCSSRECFSALFFDVSPASLPLNYPNRLLDECRQIGPKRNCCPRMATRGTTLWLSMVKSIGGATEQSSDQNQSHGSIEVAKLHNQSASIN